MKGATILNISLKFIREKPHILLKFLSLFPKFIYYFEQ